MATECQSKDADNVNCTIVYEDDEVVVSTCPDEECKFCIIHKDSNEVYAMQDLIEIVTSATRE